MAQCPQCGTALPTTSTVCNHCQADVTLWLARAGQVYGPYTLADLQQSQREGRLGRDDMVMIGGEGRWEPLANFLGLTITQLPPPVPPPATTVSGPATPVLHRSKDPTLLIVFAVVAFLMVGFIAILAAILFPVFTRAREKARQTSCLANMKQLSLAMLMYAQDWNEHFPPRPTWSRPERLQDAVISPGATTYKLNGYCAPDNWRIRFYPYVKNEAIYVCPTTSSLYSYQFNEKLCRVKLGKITNPSDLLALYDFGASDGSSWPPHNGGYNAGYVDGHCKWLPETDARQAKTQP